MGREDHSWPLKKGQKLYIELEVIEDCDLFRDTNVYDMAEMHLGYGANKDVKSRYKGVKTVSLWMQRDLDIKKLIEAVHNRVKDTVQESFSDVTDRIRGG